MKYNELSLSLQLMLEDHSKSLNITPSELFNNIVNTLQKASIYKAQKDLGVSLSVIIMVQDQLKKQR